MDLSKLNRAGVIAAIEEIFEHENLLIVIDDIDTLTTKKLDAGFDLLFRLAIKAPKTIRLLYTQRNPPPSLENSFNVPGFTVEQDYLEFLKNCSDLFRTEMPSAKFAFSDLLKATEGIPLILETIVGLRKSCGTYEKALTLFMERKGAESRKYLFEREYHSLAEADDSRNALLAGTKSAGCQENSQV